MTIDVAKYVSLSFANGPGKRCVLWFQGCDKNCPECCNPEFKEFKKINQDINELALRISEDIIKNNLRGITLTGGEPLHLKNIKPIKKLLANIKQDVDKDIDIFVFSGLEKEEISQLNINFPDIIISGPYIEKLKRSKGLVASSNQEIIRLSNKFNDVSDEEILNGKRIVEIHSFHNNIVMSGLINRKDL